MATVRDGHDLEATVVWEEPKSDDSNRRHKSCTCIRNICGQDKEYLGQQTVTVLPVSVLSRWISLSLPTIERTILRTTGSAGQPPSSPRTPHKLRATYPQLIHGYLVLSIGLELLSFVGTHVFWALG